MTQESKRRLVSAGVLAAVAALVFGFVPTAISNAQVAAERARCQNNLQQLAFACESHAAVSRYLPSGGGSRLRSGEPRTPAIPLERRLGWCVAVLPYIEEGALAQRFNWLVPADTDGNREVGAIPLRQFVCPTSDEARPERWQPDAARPAPSITHYVGVAGVGTDAATLPAADPRAGVFGYDRRIRMEDITDGTRNTLLLVETAATPGRWAFAGYATVRGIDPGDALPFRPDGPFGGFHPHERTKFGRAKSYTFNVAMIDGSVRAIRPDIDPGVLAALATIQGGESVSIDW